MAFQFLDGINACGNVEQFVGISDTDKLVALTGRFLWGRLHLALCQCGQKGQEKKKSYFIKDIPHEKNWIKEHQNVLKTAKVQHWFFLNPFTSLFSLLTSKQNK
jgi:hypothetical protein